jgi:hypothetical protein
MHARDDDRGTAFSVSVKSAQRETIETELEADNTVGWERYSRDEYGQTERTSGPGAMETHRMHTGSSRTHAVHSGATSGCIDN